MTARNINLSAALGQWDNSFKSHSGLGERHLSTPPTLTTSKRHLEQALLNFFHWKDCDLTQRGMQPCGEGATPGQEAGSGPNLKDAISAVPTTAQGRACQTLQLQPSFNTYCDTETSTGRWFSSYVLSAVALKGLSNHWNTWPSEKLLRQKNKGKVPNTHV